MEKGIGVKEEYERCGYEELAVFPGEYILMIDRRTYKYVRLYENGAVWVRDERGEYVKS